MLQALNGSVGGCLFRLFFAVAGALSNGVAVEQNTHNKGFVVIRAGRTHQLIGEHLTAFSLDQFLEIGFVIPAGLVYLIHVGQVITINK